MNKRIKELVEESGLYMIPNSILEKFAELVIKDVLRQVHLTTNHDAFADEIADYVYEEVKKIYGVE